MGIGTSIAGINTGPQRMRIARPPAGGRVLGLDVSRLRRETQHVSTVSGLWIEREWADGRG